MHQKYGTKWPQKKKEHIALYQAYAQNKPGALEAIFLKPYTLNKHNDLLCLH